jgi:hypothetical protein
MRRHTLTSAIVNVVAEVREAADGNRVRGARAVYNVSHVRDGAFWGCEQNRYMPTSQRLIGHVLERPMMCGRYSAYSRTLFH